MGKVLRKCVAHRPPASSPPHPLPPPPPPDHHHWQELTRVLDGCDRASLYIWFLFLKWGSRAFPAAKNLETVLCPLPPFSMLHRTGSVWESFTVHSFFRLNKKICVFLVTDWTVPKFRSATLIFLLSFLDIYNWFSQKNAFRFCFCNVHALQTTRQPRANY